MILVYRNNPAIGGGINNKLNRINSFGVFCHWYSIGELLKTSYIADKWVLVKHKRLMETPIWSSTT